MKLRNKIFSAIMAVVTTMSVACMSALAADPSVALNPSATEVKAGDTFTVDVVTANNPGVYSLGFNVTADSGLTLTNAANGSIYTGAIFDKAYKNNYTLLWMIDDMAETDCTENGIAATLTYTVNADATPGTYNISIATDTKSTDNCAFEGVDFGSASTTITVVADEPEVTTKTVGFVGALTYGAKAQNSTGVKFNLTTDDAAKTTQTAFYEIPFGTTFEADAEITVGLNVTNVPEAVTVGATAELY